MINAFYAFDEETKSYIWIKYPYSNDNYEFNPNIKVIESKKM